MNDTPFEPIKETVYENTYITTPEGHGEDGVCHRYKLQRILHDLIRSRIAGHPYDPVHGAQVSKQLADDVTEQIEALGCNRYKRIVEVTLGQKRGQAMRIVSRCLWNSKTDTFATKVYEGEDVYCCIQVYALYHE